MSAKPVEEIPAELRPLYEAYHRALREMVPDEPLPWDADEDEA